MKYPILLLALVMLLSASEPVAAQDSEEAKIIATVLAESQTYFERDAEGWKNSWIHDEKSTRTFASSVGINTASGWDAFGPNIYQYLLDNPEPTATEVNNDNYLITRSGDMAWVEYEQTLINPNNPNLKQVGLQQRTLMKIDGEWKVRAQMSYQNFTFDFTNPYIVEGVTNAFGYNMMEAEHVDKAIEIFNMNVGWFPDSWNAYDSLAEAYMKAGDKEQAIAFYEKSIEMNPENEGGKEALAKLTEDK